MEAARSALKQRDHVKAVRDCGVREIRSVRWRCVEWDYAKLGIVAVQRSYVTRQGSSMMGVMFTAIPKERFAAFGEPAWWLENTELRGPSIAYTF